MTILPVVYEQSMLWIFNEMFGVGKKKTEIAIKLIQCCCMEKRSSQNFQRRVGVGQHMDDAFFFYSVKNKIQIYFLGRLKTVRVEDRVIYLDVHDGVFLGKLGKNRRGGDKKR